jgi:Transcriptional regulators
MNAKELGVQRYNNRFRILEALDRHDPPLSPPDIARKTGKSVQAVWKTINGQSHSEEILRSLRAHGVSEKYLFDPRKLGVPVRPNGMTARRKQREVA